MAAGDLEAVELAVSLQRPQDEEIQCSWRNLAPGALT